MGSLGIPLDRAERRFCRDAARDSCGVCAAAAAHRAEARLFAGAARAVKLATNAGEAGELWKPWPMEIRWMINDDKMTCGTSTW